MSKTLRMTATDLTYLPFENGLQEYKTRKVDWNAYEEQRLVTNEIKHCLHDYENESAILPPNAYVVFELLRDLKDFVARLKILLYAEKYFTNPECVNYWKAQGRPFLELLLLDLVNLDLEAYQKCKVLTKLNLENIDEATQSLLAFLKYCCSGDDKDELGFGSLALQVFLEVPKNRSYLIVNRLDFVELLVQRLATVKNNQVQYQFLFSLWLLTFQRCHCDVLLSISDLIPIMLGVAKLAVKEKVKRLVVLCFNNFMRLSKEKAISLFVGTKVSSFVDALAGTNVVDEELSAEVALLSESLNHAIQKLSTFDEYASEIKSGQLDWSPPHKSELFWKDNANKFDENDLELLRLLAAIIADGQDPKKIAIACHDIGQYIDHSPHGKKNVGKLGLKESIMKLIAHEDSEVRFYALSTVQKYMSNFWSTI